MVTRNSVRVALCALALGGVSVAHAQTTAAAGDFTGFMQRVTGANSVTVGVGSGGQLVVTKPSAALGGTSGWTSAANFGTGSTNGGVRIGMSGNATVAGVKVPVTVATPISRAALADGMGILVRNAARFVGPLGVAVMVADMAAHWPPNASIRPNIDPATQNDQPFQIKKITGHGSWWLAGGPHGSAEAACKANWPNSPGVYAKILPGDGKTAECFWDGGSLFGFPTFQGTMVEEWKNTNWDLARQDFEEMQPLPADTLPKQLEWARKQAADNGIEPYKVAVEPSTVTAPTSTQPETKTETKTRVEQTPAGPKTITTTTTTTTTTEISTEGDKLKVEPKTTTTTKTKTTNPDGSVTETTDTETTESTTDEDPTTKPEERGLCDLYPDILACAKPDLDTPDSEIPRADKELSYEAEDLFGTGSCPANLQASLATLGQSVTVWDWQKTCEMALPLRALVVALASFAAFLIVMPGESRV